ncbi:unnamed protein product, partial [Effrenium voratum]
DNEMTVDEPDQLLGHNLIVVGFQHDHFDRTRANASHIVQSCSYQLRRSEGPVHAGQERPVLLDTVTLPHLIGHPREGLAGHLRYDMTLHMVTHVDLGQQQAASADPVNPHTVLLDYVVPDTATAQDTATDRLNVLQFVIPNLHVLDLVNLTQKQHLDRSRALTLVEIPAAELTTPETRTPAQQTRLQDITRSDLPMSQVQVLTDAILGAGIHVHREDVFTRSYHQNTMRLTGIHLHFRDASPFGNVAHYHYCWAHGTTRAGAAGILKDRLLRPNSCSSGSDFPSYGAQGHLNEDNANELLRKLYRIGKGQQAAVILGEYSGNVAHARTDAGGVSEIQRLCRHHGAVRGGYWAFHAAHSTIRQIIV